MPRRKKKQIIQTKTDEQNEENSKPIYLTNKFKQEQALKIKILVKRTLLLIIKQFYKIKILIQIIFNLIVLNNLILINFKNLIKKIINKLNLRNFLLILIINKVNLSLKRIINK